MTHHHAEKEADIEITLHGHPVLRTSGGPEKARLGGAQVCPVPPVGAGPDLSYSIGLIEQLSLGNSTALKW